MASTLVDGAVLSAGSLGLPTTDPVPLLDTLVGLAIAVIILKSGVELALEMVRTLRGEEMDFSRYELIDRRRRNGNGKCIKCINSFGCVFSLYSGDISTYVCEEDYEIRIAKLNHSK